MSFAPSKEKSRTLQSRGKKSAEGNSYRKEEDGKGQTLRSNKDENGSKHNQSIRSGADNWNERIINLENDVAHIQQQQDTYRQLMDLKETVENLQKDQKTIQSILKRTSKLEERLDEFEHRFDEYQRKTEQFLVVVDKNIDEESTIRQDENKALKKVCTELERRQKEMDYEIKMDMRNTEIKAKQELLAVTSDIDKKTDAHKEFLQNHIDAVHRALKSTLVDDEDKIEELNRKLQRASESLDRRVANLETSMLPTIDSANQRRKVDYNDLKAWLLDSIDERMKLKEKKLEDTVKQTYKSTVLQQKSEISDLKREISNISSSPNKRFRQSNVANSDVFEDDIEEVENPAYITRGSELGAAESRKPGLTTMGSTYKETKAKTDEIEKYIIDSGDEIGSKLDQLKIGIYDWNDKIVKAVKKVEGLKKNKKQKGTKKEIKGRF